MLYESVYSETAEIGNGVTLLGVASVRDSMWYDALFCLVRDGKAVQVLDEFCMPFYELEDSVD